MEMTKTHTQKIQLWVHTSCGLEFEFVDFASKKSLSGRMYWCSDEDLEENEGLEEAGWEKFRRIAKSKNLEIVEEVWS
jgi:hypothetical protein